ncbi:hypothetical protein F8M41_002417 [Gigaspora margarita]|uniref:Uncharacterized protein n=1 Tax=Gigaspora margarita TaxID=4874 RepID=A0A8H3XEB5_GIGMA|nr:hypothetical protein F8M41_002417 [Gigaspora margarita]
MRNINSTNKIFELHSYKEIRACNNSNDNQKIGNMLMSILTIFFMKVDHFSRYAETSSGPLPTTSSKSSLEALKTTSPIQLQDHPCEHTKDYRIRGLKVSIMYRNERLLPLDYCPPVP